MQASDELGHAGLDALARKMLAASRGGRGQRPGARYCGSAMAADGRAVGISVVMEKEEQ